jgi:glycosyltransferase involved in cell wall biosynthesis
MRLAIDLLAVDPHRRIGVETFVKNVIGSLQLHPNTSLLIAQPRDLDVIKVLGDKFFARLSRVNFARYPVTSMLVRIILEMVVLGFRCFHHDVALSINNFGPLFGKRGQRRIVVIHDVWFVDAGYEGVWWKKAIFSTLMRVQVRRVDHIVTVSEFSRSAIIHTLGVPRKKISVIQNCIEKDPKTPCPKDIVDRLLNAQKESKGSDYLLLIGSDRPNKNVIRALHAYKRLIDNDPDGPILRIVGSFCRKFIEECEEIFAKSRQKKLVFHGYVERDAYEELIRRSKGVIFISLYEGFGIPVIEAVSYGKQVLVSAGTVCEEVAGSAGIAVNGRDVEEIASGIRNLWQSEKSMRIEEAEQILRDYIDCSAQAKKLRKLIEG